MRPDAAEVFAARRNVTREPIGLRQSVPEVLILVLITDGDIILTRRLEIEARAVVRLGKRYGDVILGLRHQEILAAQNYGDRSSASADTSVSNGEDALRSDSLNRRVAWKCRQQAREFRRQKSKRAGANCGGRRIADALIRDEEEGAILTAIN